MKSPLGIIIISEQWLQPLKLPPGAKLPAENGADAGWLGKPSFANASDAALNSAAAMTSPKILGLCLLFSVTTCKLGNNASTCPPQLTSFMACSSAFSSKS
ncbi:hypothetical protein LBW60_03480 [Ralstonia solanacearum]|uniref:hypothetical protein n=1 Tax=Ralstonia solanacearum TaxID=305 RepID=UPI0015963574|nr:hypothetical protein [Ralstonia solanacearum]MDB0512402.1 hypothetical protein [Ralstonia solanacearum]